MSPWKPSPPTAPTGRPFPPPSPSPKKRRRQTVPLCPPLRPRRPARRRYRPATAARPRHHHRHRRLPNHARPPCRLPLLPHQCRRHCLPSRASSLAPETFAFPTLTYPEDDAALDTFNDSSGAVSIERDITEIDTLANETFHHRHDSRPTLSILDQRLLYWPIGGAGIADNAAVTEWGKHMTGVHQAGALLCGYIDRPGTSAVVTLLKSITAVFRPHLQLAHPRHPTSQPGTDRPRHFRRPARPRPAQQSLRQRLATQRNLRRPRPRQRSLLLLHQPRQNQSTNRPYRHSALGGRKSTSVSAVHALLIDQCRLLGDYPYVLARADETAVVGRQDASELNFMIDVIMERHGIRAGLTAKQGSKDLARGGHTQTWGILIMIVNGTRIDNSQLSINN